MNASVCGHMYEQVIVVSAVCSSTGLVLLSLIDDTFSLKGLTDARYTLCGQAIASRKGDLGAMPLNLLTGMGKCKDEGV